ncbi:MAG TPA: alpha/beta fold hydrolase [Acidobacteriaceae bacterium]|jgi:hypothetical protein
MRFGSFALVILFASSAASMAQVANPKVEVSADIIIPQPPPDAPISEWHDGPGRKAVRLDSRAAHLRGFRYEGSNPKAPELIFFNGNGMTVLSMDRFYRALAALGPSVTAYDYRGYGFSAGPATLAGFRDDGLLIYDAVAAASPGRRVVVYGASMGTAIAAAVASQRPLAGLILGMPIASAEEEFPVYGRLIGFGPEQIAQATPSSEASTIFGETTLVRQSKAPLLVLGGGADHIVPVAQAREVYAASPAANKRMVEIPSAGHNDVILTSEAMSAVATLVGQLSQ